MSMPIQTQSQQYEAFRGDSAIRALRDPREAASEWEVIEYLGGPQIHAGLNVSADRREAVDTRHMDPDSHAYHGEVPYGPEGIGGEHRHYNPYSGYEPTDRDEQAREAVGEDDDSGYNWGPEPQHDPGAVSQHNTLIPLHQMLDHAYRPDPAEPSFSQARRLGADGGPTHQGSNHPVTALAVPPAQPAAPTAPVWLGHTFAPSHRVGMPWRGEMIPGTVTHLEGMNVGVRWDDGQHSVEEPSAIRPLY